MLQAEKETVEYSAKALDSASPCRIFLQKLQSKQTLSVHLSEDYGFMPRQLICSELPESHRTWEECAAQIPQLFLSQDSQHTLEKLPTLSANKEALADEHVPRAAIILGLLASAYWRHGIDRFFSIRTSAIDDYLPHNIRKPWQQICARLGRGEQLYQSFDDLMLNNFRFLDSAMTDTEGGYRIKDAVIENIDTLIHSFGNEPERVFYMSFVEIHALASPIIAEICNIQDAILADQEASVDILIKSLKHVAQCIHACIKPLLKISPNPRSNTYCDPILWSKTVAIFAVPPSTYPQGATSGASVPFVHVIDALLGRRDYRSHYGEYTKKAGKLFLSQEHQEFLALIQSVNIKDYIIKKSQDSFPQLQALAAAYNEVVDSYAGPEGFLDKHTAKVFNYLGVATLVGRNQSTSGHERFISAETWAEVTAELKISMQERTVLQTKPCQHTRKLENGRILNPGSATKLKQYTRADVARHHHPNQGWIIIDKHVYDITDFLNKHPGGMEIIASYLGRDASKIFPMIAGHFKPNVLKLVEKMCIGSLLTAPAHPQYTDWTNILDQLVRSHAILHLQYEHSVTFAYKVLYYGQTHFHFCHDHIKQTIEQLLYDQNPMLTTAAQKIKLASLKWHPKLRVDLRKAIPQQLHTDLSHIITSYKHHDLILMKELIDTACNTLDFMQQNDAIADEILVSSRQYMLQRIQAWHQTMLTVSREENLSFISKPIAAIMQPA